MENETRAVIEELLTKPSTVVPTLFVGIGGSGCKLIRRVADHLMRRPDYKERYETLTKFAFVDTNINDLEPNRAVASEVFLISDFEKSDYSALASGRGYLDPDPYFTQWVPQNYRFRAGDTAGAGQIRIESRLGCYYQMKHKDFVPKSRKLLESLKSHETGHRRLDSGELRIVVCYSIAGGTGSGAHLPIAYVLRDLGRQLGKPRMIGVAVLPSVFESKTRANKDGTFANGYAALKETEHLMKLGAPDSRFYPEDGILFHYDPSDTSKRKVHETPFEFVYLIDRPETMSVRSVEEAAGDGLYLQFYSPLFGEQCSDYDNYTQHQRFLVPHDFEGKGIQGFTSFYGSFGAAVLHVPEDGLMEYCTHAAAMQLMRSSFLGNIPAETLYTPIHANQDAFYEVALTDSGARPIQEAEFVKKTRDERGQLEDRLFQKRVRLLASCEFDKDERGRFAAVFRHGHPLGFRPNADGGLKGQEKAADWETKNFADQGLGYSIAHAVLLSIMRTPSGRATLLRRVDEHIEGEAGKLEHGLSSATVEQLRERAWSAKEDLLREGRKLLKFGSGQGTQRLLGLDDLQNLAFLGARMSPGVSLLEQRYAVLCLRDILQHAYPQAQRPAASDLPASSGEDQPLSKPKTLKGSEINEPWNALREELKGEVLRKLTREFEDGIERLRKDLNDRAMVYRALQQGYVEIEPRKRKYIEKLREEGDFSTNRYVLDSEALQMESGDRLWDFYFEDQIADMSDLSLANPVLAECIGDRVGALAKERTVASKVTEELYKDIHERIARVLRPVIVGDPHDTDASRHHGLTLEAALKLEVAYRALFLSSRDQLDPAERADGVRRIVIQYKAARKPVNLEDPIHRDYLEDKVRRVVKEKSELLCYLDPKHLQQGGVRPDNVFLAALSKDLEDGPVGKALRVASSGEVKFVTDEWENPKEVILYRAILNVPVYVFGRMEEMKGFYHRFKNLAKRSKVLHIDKNWEDSLPDLDPAGLEAQYRERFVREQIVDFATLLTFPIPSLGTSPIVWREGAYYLQSVREESLDPGHDLMEPGPVLLGDRLLTAIARVPEAFEAESVRFSPYRGILQATRRGYSPEILSKIVGLPAQWKRNAENLRNRFGARPEILQQEKIDDYRKASQRLYEALKNLLEDLRDQEAERQATEVANDTVLEIDGSVLTGQEASRLVRQSIQILVTFVESWENRDRIRRLPGSVGQLFQPIDEKKLQEQLNQMSTGLNGQKGDGQKAASSPSTPEQPQDKAPDQEKPAKA